MSMDTEHKADARDVLDLGAAPSMTEDKPAEAGATVSVPEVEADAKQELDIPQEEIERITRDVIEALKTVFDPEIPVDIYELGLIYKVDIDDDRKVDIDMTLTAPGCPVAGDMPGWVENAARTVEGVEDVEVRLTFDPPWDPSRMSDEARLALNML